MHWAWRIILSAVGSLALAQSAVAELPAAPVPASDVQMVGSLRLHNRVDGNALPAFLLGDSVHSDEQNRVILTGHAQVRRIDSVVKGDRIEYDRDSGDLDVRGNGLLMREGSIVTGTHLRYNINAEKGEIEAPNFWLGAQGGAGTADHADILSRDHLRLDKVRYSGCPCPDPAWYIESSRMDLYTSENEGVARHGVLYFKDVPILYSPYLTFPLTKERKSGFLIPTYGTSSNSGFEATLPYYLNLAPNYDATITPRFMSKRGVQLGAEFRYLDENYHGQASGTYIMRDQQTQTNRWLYSIQHDQYLGHGFNANIDVRRVSDDNYFRDFSTFGLNDAAVSYLPSQAMVSWSDGRYFSSSLQAYRYQTLQDSTGSFLTPPYDKLPEFYVRAQHYDWHGFDVVSDNYATRFVSPLYTGDAFPDMSGVRQNPDGTRLTSYTSISRPFVLPGAYLTPKVGLHMSQYDTQWYADELPQFASRHSSQSRVLPITSVDSGLTFERNTTLFGNDAIQTIEPRAYYLYVPYRDQSTLPVYDTGIATFNYNQAFDENIFSGSDRISNANQLTVGLTSRWLDAGTGFERLTLSAAQRLYFADQRVALGDEALRSSAQSDYLFGANAALTDKFSVYFDGQFNPETNQRSRMSSGMRWTPKRLATVSLSYRYERDPNVYVAPYQGQGTSYLTSESNEQISVNGQWPLSKRWYGMGRYDYSIQEKRNTQSIFGLEYKGDCCWAARVVMQRYAVSAEHVNTAVFLQLELTGLGSLGTDPMNLLTERITGYEPVSPPISEKTAFERYE